MAYLKIGDEIPTKGKGSKLSALQQKFVEAYTDPSGPGYRLATGAVRVAGYKTNNPAVLGTQLMQQPLVVQTIKEIEQARRERLELTADYVINKLMDLVEGTDKDNDRIRALELLGKNLGLFKERQEISGPDGKAIEYEQKLKEDANDFTRAIARLAKRSEVSDTELREAGNS